MTWCFLCMVYCEFGFRKCCSIVLHFDSQNVFQNNSQSPLVRGMNPLYKTASSSTNSE